MVPTSTCIGMMHDAQQRGLLTVKVKDARKLECLGNGAHVTRTRGKYMRTMNFQMLALQSSTTVSPQVRRVKDARCIDAE